MHRMNFWPMVRLLGGIGFAIIFGGLFYDWIVRKVGKKAVAIAHVIIPLASSLPPKEIRSGILNRKSKDISAKPGALLSEQESSIRMLSIIVPIFNEERQHRSII